MNNENIRLGLIGENIAGSLSPSLFSWAMVRTGVTGSYAIYDFPRRLARPFICRSKGEWNGLNVTSPHKDLAYELCDSLTPAAEAIRAVNTLHCKDHKIYGDNTDAAGFEYALRHRIGQRDEPQKALVVGSGGAARACLFTLRKMLPNCTLHVATRRSVSARDRLASMSSIRDSVEIITHKRAHRWLMEYDLIVQATPVGSLAHPGYPLDPPLNFKQNALVMDLVYTPSRTLFMEAAEAFGAATDNGLVMLIAQGAASFNLWTGLEFPLADAMETLLPEFQKR